MWPKLLWILNDGNIMFLSLHTANMEISSVSCYKKLTCFQMDHISTLTWRQISQSISTLPLLFSRKTEIQLPRVFHPAHGHCTAVAQFCGTELPLNNLELARTGLSQQKHHHNWKLSTQVQPDQGAGICLLNCLTVFYIKFSRLMHHCLMRSWLIS